MKSLSFATIAAGLLSATSPGVEPPTAYLETSPITILWQFNETIVDAPRSDAVTTAAAAIVKYIEEPDGLSPLERITSETGKPLVYPYATGNQAFFIKYLFRNVLERYAENSKSRITEAAAADAAAAAALADAATARANALANAGDPMVAAAYEADALAYDADALQYAAAAANATSEANSYEAKIQTVKRELSDKWELTAVRKPQTTLAGVMGDDYRIFLTRIDPFRGRVIRGYDSGLRLVTKYSAPKTTETLSGNTLVKVTGTATTYFTLALSAMYATDPLYLVAFESRGTQEEGTDYNTGGENWEILGGGYMTYSVRCTAGTPVAVAPTKMKITGYGSWYHMTFDLANNGADYFSGTAPLNIRMGEVKYQRSEYFPEFFAAGGP